MSIRPNSDLAHNPYGLVDAKLKDLYELLEKIVNISTEIKAVAALDINIPLLTEALPNINLVAPQLNTLMAAAGSAITFTGFEAQAIDRQTVFTMDQTVINEYSLIVWVNSVRQSPITDFSVDGATLTFVEELENEDQVEVIFFNGASFEEIEALRDESAANAVSSRKWAMNTTDEQVDAVNYPGVYSAKHYAEKTAEVFESIETFDARVTSVEDDVTTLQSDVTTLQSSSAFRMFDTVESLLADTGLTYTAGQPGTVTVGQMVTVGPAQYRVMDSDADYDIQTSHATVPVRLNFMGYDVRPDDILPNTVPGTTDMTNAINKAAQAAARTGAVMRPSPKPALVSSTVIIPPSVSFDGPGGSNYANPSRSTVGHKLVNTKTTAGAVVSITGTRLQSQGGSTKGLWVTSGGVGATTDLTGVNVYGIEIISLFNHIFTDLNVDHFNGAWAILASGTASNKLVLLNPRIAIVGARVAGLTTRAYGGGLYLVAAPDSNVINPFIEALDGDGIHFAGNSKLTSGFIDFCDRGVLLTNGKNTTITETSVKFHWRNAFVISDSINCAIRNVTAISSNLGGASFASNDSATIKLNANVKNLEIDAAHFAHIQQWRGPNIPAVITLGGAGNTAVMHHCILGDVCVNGTHIMDPNGVWAAGGFEFRDNTLLIGSARADLTTPVAYASVVGNVISSDKFTVTEGVSTYVIKGSGTNLPYTVPAVFDANYWVLLQEREDRGLVVPNDVTDNFGNMTIRVMDGSTGEPGLTLGQRCNISGTIKTYGLTKLLDSGGGSFAPAFICDARPDTIANVLTDSGTVKIRGLSWPVNVSHGGTSLAEDFALADLPASFSGKVTVTGREATSKHFAITTDLAWDGTTLAVGTPLRDFTSSAFVEGTATFVADSGELKLRLTSAIATNINCQFEFSDGYWTVE